MAELKELRGVLPAMIKAKELNLQEIIIPFKNLKGASLIRDLKIIRVKTFKRGYKLFKKRYIPKIQYSEIKSSFYEKYEVDFAEVLEQELAKKPLK